MYRWVFFLTFWNQAVMPKQILNKKSTRIPDEIKVKRLYLNAGAASGMPWDLTNGKLSKGMAAIVHIHATEGVHADLISVLGIFRLSRKVSNAWFRRILAPFEQISTQTVIHLTGTALMGFA